ncbi:leucyl aminopeptidase [Novosphingobium beihaiensis]|uniref:Probable cytosol aminopeptidase n=1 Tax=Novosphingobium beihaiensis TaxID=2930389 RepID=A0ABT0BLH9_9SPHN|nr:leucyl aminopeptidase [Novosphingobium beihaiensis]MCJ2185899.1 leucyl aminopeptidase [Novosphingobium beihaiensis]
MQIQFLDAPVASSARLAARLVNQDAVPADLEPVLAEAAKMARFSGKAGQMFEGFAERDGKVVRVVLAGIGAADAKDRKGAIEKAGAAIVAKYLTSGETALTLDVTGAGLSAEEAAAALLGAVLRAWRHDVYRTKLTDDKKPSLSEIALAGAPEGTKALWAVEQAVAAGVAFTRELVTEPANTIYPETFVERCQAKTEGTGLKIRVLDEKEMAALGMGSLLGVAQGSVRPARLLVMEWLGGAEGEKPVAFVGKGVTFDTGGISLKQPAGMEDMKWDMGGAGAVAGTMLALALRKAKANVIGVCGLVENMPDGKAQRPGDVVTSMSGQTIEVINTDAEGRLVLCDALTWVQREYSPAKIVDLATLTGAIIASLAHEYAGLFSNNDDLAAALSAAGDASGDRLWRFPMGPAYDKQLDSAIADMKNVGSRFGGSITAAQFLQRFIENGTPWAHLDIAGTVWSDKPGATWDKGATGFGVRLLDRFVRDTAEG